MFPQDDGVITHNPIYTQDNTQSVPQDDLDVPKKWPKVNTHVCNKYCFALR